MGVGLFTLTQQEAMTKVLGIADSLGQEYVTVEKIMRSRNPHVVIYQVYIECYGHWVSNESFDGAIKKLENYIDFNNQVGV